MRTVRRAAALLLLLALPAAAQDLASLPAGTYRTDMSHSTLAFEVDHLGFSAYVAGFDRFDATLSLDPAAPERATLEVRVPLASLDLPSPPEGFREMLLGAGWLDAAATPEMIFRSTSVTLTGPDAARVEGELLLAGRTAPVTLEVRANGGWEGFDLDPQARIGFSATGVLRRSDWGISIGLPPPGSRMGVGDAVRVRVETEMIGPAWTP